MADDKKVKKTKKKKEEEAPAAAPSPAEAEPPAAAAAEPPAPAPASVETPATVVVTEPEPAAVPAAKRPSTKGSRKAQRSGSNVYAVFSQKQVAEFKEAFQMMDVDKDGIIGKSDLSATFEKVGKVPDDDETNEMLNEAPGPLNFTMLLSLFANRMSGSADEDDVVINAFKCFDDKGKISAENLRFQLMTFGDRLTEQEVDDAFDNMLIDSVGRIETARVISMLTAREEDDEE